MKEITINQIREELAAQDADNTETRTLFDVFLDGCPGYANTEPWECLDYYVQRGGFLDLCLEDNDAPVPVGRVIDDTGKLLFTAEQYCQEVQIKEV